MNHNEGSCPFTGQSTKCPVTNDNDQFSAKDFDAFDKPYQLDPALALEWSRDKAPVFYSEKMGYWIVSRYDDIKTVFRDPVLFSARNVLEKITPATPEATQVLKDYNYNMSRTLVNEDEPAHMERRRVLIDHFLPENLAPKEEMIRRLTREKVDEFIESGRVDLVDGLLHEVPLLVALHFLGVPEDEIAKLKTFSVAHSVNTWGKPTDEQQIGIAHDVGQFWQYAGEIIEKMRADTNGEGWMHYTIKKNAEMPDIVPDSYVHSMMMAIIVAAHETTSLASANMFRTLLTHREAWDDICADPNLIPNAVEECLRFAGSIVAWRRETTAPTTLAGINLPEGAKLLIVQASGNRDERYFENGNDFDIYRDNTTDHLTFGYGAHQCMGKNIARMEMRIFLEELTRRIPHMRLAEQEFSYPPSTSFRGPEKVWVEWDPTLNPESIETNSEGRIVNFSVGAPQKQNIARRVKIVKVRKEADDILSVVLADARGRPLPKWSPGAHVEIISGGYSRKYSLSGKNDSNAYQLAILKEENGKGGSQYFHGNLHESMELKLRGPSNCFHLDKTASHYILVAGGIGITPIIAMADHLKEMGKSYHIHYAGQASSKMAFLDRLATEHKGNYTIYAKDEGKRVDLSSLTTNMAKGSQIYACGPQRMIEALLFLTKDLPDNTLFYEYFSGVNTVLDPEREQSFDVELLDSGITFTVKNTQTLLEAIESVGIDIVSDCKEGLCGSCEVLVSEGDVDHRDTVLTNSERKSNTRMMVCCSRAIKGSKLKLNL
jgi:cytochrome P450/ferredoxin-NADP reductase